LAKSDVALETRAFLNLAIPLAIAQVAQFAVSFVDTIMMGHLGTASLAAGGLASGTFQMALTVITGFVMSVGVLAAEAYGADKKHRLTGLARQGLWLSLLLAVPFMLLLTQMTSVLTFLQQPATVVNLAQRYYSGIAFGVLPALGFAMLRGYLSAFSLAGVVTGVVAIGTAFNIACNYVLGFGKFGFPRLGLLGLGIGSSLSLWLMLLLFSLYILRHPELNQYQFWRGWQYPNRKILRRLATVGAPISLTLILELGMFTTLAFMAGSLGTEVLAAHQISFQVIALIFMVPIGMSQAVTTRVGLWFGRGDISGARRAGLVAAGAVAIFLGVSAIALFTFRPLLIGLFIDRQDARSAEVVAIAMNLLLIASMSQVPDGVQRVVMSALYGLQDTRVPVILSAIAFWGIGITSGYVLCFLVGWDAVGLWIGQYTGSAVAGAMFIGRFYSLTRRRFSSAGR
ncbi:MATE family efflux transporter, partial [cf. Phormidesmis sp. LEGE 11477]|uniref:MATE family efflux transporter n=1 Tax=cf. Phormidesmis sp. LEGE 11477 TaxID=1828680 RepID=UPI001881DB1F